MKTSYKFIILIILIGLISCEDKKEITNQEIQHARTMAIWQFMNDYADGYDGGVFNVEDVAVKYDPEDEYFTVDLNVDIIDISNDTLSVVCIYEVSHNDNDWEAKFVDLKEN